MTAVWGQLWGHKWSWTWSCLWSVSLVPGASDRANIVGDADEAQNQTMRTHCAHLELDHWKSDGFEVSQMMHTLRDLHTSCREPSLGVLTFLSSIWALWGHKGQRLLRTNKEYREHKEHSESLSPSHTLSCSLKQFKSILCREHKKSCSKIIVYCLTQNCHSGLPSHIWKWPYKLRTQNED